MDSVTFGQFLRDFGGPLAALVAIVWSGAKRYWVFGWVYEDEVKRHREAEARAEARIEKSERLAEQWKQVALETQDSQQLIVTAIRDSVRASLTEARSEG